MIKHRKKVDFVQIVGLLFLIIGLWLIIYNCFLYYREDKVIATKYVDSEIIDISTRTESTQTGTRHESHTYYITTEIYELNGETITDTFRYYTYPEEPIQHIAVSEDEITWRIDDGYKDNMAKIVAILIGGIFAVVGVWVFKQG